MVPNWWCLDQVQASKVNRGFPEIRLTLLWNIEIATIEGYRYCTQYRNTYQFFEKLDTWDFTFHTFTYSHFYTYIIKLMAFYLFVKIQRCCLTIMKNPWQIPKIPGSQRLKLFVNCWSKPFSQQLMNETFHPHEWWHVYEEQSNII